MQVPSREVLGKSEKITLGLINLHIYICIMTRSLDLCDIGAHMPFEVKTICTC